LHPYKKNFVRSRLEEFPETPAANYSRLAQEAYDNLPGGCPAKKRSITLLMAVPSGVMTSLEENVFREYGPVEELPYGETSTSCFCECTTITATAKQQKSVLSCMVLLQKTGKIEYIWFF